jgi:lysozyme
MLSPKVIDLSHHVWDNHPNLDFAKAKAAGVIGVVYKATEGSTFQDPFYHKTQAAVIKAGLLWGAFHFATLAPAQAQADNFLKTARPTGDMLVAIDFEHNDRVPGNTVTPAIALEILKIVGKSIGRRPTLYTGRFMTDLFGSKPAPDFAPFRLWWATYASKPAVHPTWKDYWLWQYTDGVRGRLPHGVDGIGPCDCNIYDGSAIDLVAEWAQ